MAKLINVYRSEDVADIEVKRRQLPIKSGDLQVIKKHSHCFCGVHIWLVCYIKLLLFQLHYLSPFTVYVFLLFFLLLEPISGAACTNFFLVLILLMQLKFVVFHPLLTAPYDGSWQQRAHFRFKYCKQA